MKNQPQEYIVYNFGPPASLECKLCQTVHQLKLPCGLVIVCDIMKSFYKVHKSCLKNKELIAAFMTKRLLANK